MQTEPLLPNAGSFTLDPERGRESVAREMVTSEKSYIYNIELCLTAVLLPLRERVTMAQKQGKRLSTLRRKEKFATPEELATIFSNLETLFELHKIFLTKLEDATQEWNALSTIADVFISETSFFAEYTRYANQFSFSSSALGTCRQRKSFHSFLEQIEFSTGVMLPSFLIMPIQRLPRYELLLKELKKYTPESHPDYANIQQALKMIKQYTRKTNIAVYCTLSRVSAEFARQEAVSSDENVKGEDQPNVEDQPAESKDTSHQLPQSEQQPQQHTARFSSQEHLSTISEGEEVHHFSPLSKSEGAPISDHSTARRHSSPSSDVAETEESVKRTNSGTLAHPALLNSSSRRMSSEKIKRRLSLGFPNSSRDKDKDKDHTNTTATATSIMKPPAPAVSAFFVQEGVDLFDPTIAVAEATTFARDDDSNHFHATLSDNINNSHNAGATARKAKRRSFRLTWSSLGDFKETISQSFHEFQQEELQLQQQHQQEDSGGSSDSARSSDSGGTLRDSKSASTTTTKEEKDKRRLWRKSKEFATSPPSPPTIPSPTSSSSHDASTSSSASSPSSSSSSSHAPAPQGRKLSRLVGSVMELRNGHKNSSNNKQDSGEWKNLNNSHSHSLRDKIETQG